MAYWAVDKRERVAQHLSGDRYAMIQYRAAIGDSPRFVMVEAESAVEAVKKAEERTP